VGCIWIEDTILKEGVCVPSSSTSFPFENLKNLSCENLLKKECNKFINMNKSYTESENVINNGPCIFNGANDMDLGYN
jgi:hypothetical protein